MKKTTQILHDTALLAVICAAALLSVLITPRASRVAKPMGAYTFANTGDSFSLYGVGSHKYILFTPEEKTRHIQQTPETKKTLSHRASLATIDLYNHITMYIFHNKPWHTTIADASAILSGMNVQMTTKTSDLVITYGRDDIVIVNDDAIITENNQSILEELKNQAGKTLVTVNPAQRTVLADTNTITVINPNIPGSIRITLPQSRLITINKDARAIHLSGPVSLSATVLPPREHI